MIEDFFLSNVLQEEQQYFTMAFSLDHVKALLETDSVMDLKSIQSMIAGKFKRPPLLSQGRLYELLTITKTVKREIMLERDVPAEYGNAVALSYAF